MSGVLADESRAYDEGILEDLKKSHKVNQKTWRRLLERVPAEKMA